jgi:hypothetical protein
MEYEYKITLNEAQNKAMAHIAYDVNEWIQNLVMARYNLAIDEIVNMEVQRKLAAGEPITGSKEDIVLAADIESAADREARLEEEFRKLQEQQG